MIGRNQPEGEHSEILNPSKSNLRQINVKKSTVFDGDILKWAAFV